jgi:tetratricopeptide (TPR) repeat protein
MLWTSEENMLSNKTSAEKSLPLRNGRLWAAYLLLLLILGFAQFWDARLFPFYSDDFDYIQQAKAISESPGALLSPDYKSSGRPAATALVAVVHTIFGDNPAPYHILTFTLHVLAACVLAWTFARLGYGRDTAMVAGILFLFNVSHYEVPYWLSCISYPGCLAAGCLTVVYHAEHVEEGASRYISWVMILVAAAFHAGAIAFVLLAGFVVYRRSGNLQSTARATLPLLGINLVYLAAIALAYPEHMQLEAVERSTDPIHILYLTMSYVGHAFLAPHWLNDAYVEGLGVLEASAGFLIVLAALATRRFWREVPIDAIAWTVLLSVVFAGSAAEEYRSRYLYFASTGPSLFFGWLAVGAGRFGARRGIRASKVAVPICLLAAIVILSHIELGKTTSIFWGAVGRSYITGENPAAGLAYLERAIAETPHYVPATAYARYATLAIALGRDPVPSLQTARQHHPANAELEALQDVAILCRDEKPPSDEWIRRIRSHDTQTLQVIAAALNNGGIYQTHIGNLSQAARLFAVSLQLLPDYPSALSNLGNTLAFLGQTEQSLAVFEKLFGLDDARTQAMSISGLTEVVATHPDAAYPRAYLARAYLAQGDPERASDILAIALQQHPDEPALQRVRDYLLSPAVASNDSLARAIRTRLLAGDEQ